MSLARDREIIIVIITIGSNITVYNNDDGGIVAADIPDGILDGRLRASVDDDDDAWQQDLLFVW